MINHKSKIINLKSPIFSIQFFQIVRFGSLFITSIILPRLSSDNLLINDYETLLLTAGSVTFFWVTGILKTFVPFYYSSNEVEKKQLCWNTFITFSGAAMLSALTALFLLSSNSLIHHTGLKNIFLFYLFFNSVSSLTEYLFFVQNKYSSLYIYCILVYLLYVLSIAVPLYYFKDLYYSFLCLAVLSLLKFIFLLIVISNSQKPTWNFYVLKSQLILTLPVVVATLIAGSAEYFDSFLVKFFFSPREFTYFRYGAKELPVILLLANSISMALSGDIAQAFKKNEMYSALHKLKTITLKLSHFAFPFSILLIVFSKQLYPLVYTSSFAESSGIFNIFLLLVISRVLFPQTILLGLGKTTIFIWISTLELIIHVFLTLLFFHWFGTKGAAMASVISFLLEKIFLVIYCSRKLKIHYSAYIPIKWWTFYSFMILIFYFIFSL